MSVVQVSPNRFYTMLQFVSTTSNETIGRVTPTARSDRPHIQIGGFLLALPVGPKSFGL